MAAVDSPSAWWYSALRWFTTRWIRATARGRCTQLPACLIATTSDFLVAALVVSSVSTAAACREADAADGPEDEVCGRGVPGPDCFDRTNATTTATTTIAVPRAPIMSLVRLGVGRDGRRCRSRPGPAGHPPPPHPGRPAVPAPAPSAPPAAPARAPGAPPAGAPPGRPRRPARPPPRPARPPPPAPARRARRTRAGPVRPAPRAPALPAWPARRACALPVRPAQLTRTCPLRR